MTCVKKQFLTVHLLCRFEIFHSLHFDKTIEFFPGSRRKLAEKPQHSSETVEAFPQEFGSFFVALFGKCEAKVYRSRAAEVACEYVSDFSHTPAEQHGCRRGKSTKSAEDGFGRRVL